MLSLYCFLSPSHFVGHLLSGSSSLVNWILEPRNSFSTRGSNPRLSEIVLLFVCDLHNMRQVSSLLHYLNQLNIICASVYTGTVLYFPYLPNGWSFANYKECVSQLSVTQTCCLNATRYIFVLAEVITKVVSIGLWFDKSGLDCYRLWCTKLLLAKCFTWGSILRALILIMYYFIL